MTSETYIHVGFQRDGSEKMILSTNPERDTTASFAYKFERIADDKVLHVWYYGVNRNDLVEPIFKQIKRAILNDSFKEWFK